MVEKCRRQQELNNSNADIELLGLKVSEKINRANKELDEAEEILKKSPSICGRLKVKRKLKKAKRLLERAQKINQQFDEYEWQLEGEIRKLEEENQQLEEKKQKLINHLSSGS